MKKTALILWALLSSQNIDNQIVIDSSIAHLHQVYQHFYDDFKVLKLPEFELSYQDNFKKIQSLDTLEKRLQLLKAYQDSIKFTEALRLNQTEQIHLAHFRYLISHFQERTLLEKSYKTLNHNAIEKEGLSKMPNSKAWCQFYIKQYTSTDLTPKQLKNFGKKEVKRCQKEINRIQKAMGYEGKDEAFYAYLKNENFYLTDYEQILKEYRKKEQIIRSHLYNFFDDTTCSTIQIKAWDNATLAMPPAIYFEDEFSFNFNFAGGKHNKRAMDWILNHEAIPGHHFQISNYLKNQTYKPPFESMIFYGGNIEGWACYTEYLGKELGQYQTLESELGKWEWDLVRSLRVVLDVGIHYEGWTKQQALNYWYENIKGQNEIAEREVNRVTNWPAQALSYKVGAMKIETMKKKLQINTGNIKQFHKAYLSFSNKPLSIIEQYIKI